MKLFINVDNVLVTICLMTAYCLNFLELMGRQEIVYPKIFFFGIGKLFINDI